MQCSLTINNCIEELVKEAVSRNYIGLGRLDYSFSGINPFSSIRFITLEWNGIQTILLVELRMDVDNRDVYHVSNKVVSKNEEKRLKWNNKSVAAV